MLNLKLRYTKNTINDHLYFYKDMMNNNLTHVCRKIRLMLLLLRTHKSNDLRIKFFNLNLFNLRKINKQNNDL